MSYKTDYGMDDTLPFGKYKGTEIEEVLEDDPKYLKWMHENTDIEFDEEVIHRIERL